MLKLKQKDIVMKHKDYVREHVKLIKILWEGDEEDLVEEAKSQCKELKGRISSKEFQDLDLED